MGYTKKQITAFQDILAWCPPDRCAPVVHRATIDDKFVVTDGSVCVILDECPEGLPVDDNGQVFYDFCKAEIDDGDHELAESSVTITDCKAVIRQWKEQVRKKVPGTSGRPRIQVSGKASAQYDARRVLYALTAIGPKARVYIGRRVRGRSYLYVPPPSLIVSNWEVTTSYAVILPLRTS